MRNQLAAVLGGASIIGMGLIALGGPPTPVTAPAVGVVEPVTAVATIHDMATTTTTTTTAIASYRPSVIARIPPPPAH